MNEQEYIAGETCYRPEPSKCYYSPCGKIGKCVKDIPDYDPRNPVETYNVKFVTDNMPQYYKIKMPAYYIAKHSDEDLQAAIEVAVFAERLKCSEDYLADCAAAVEAARLEEREACAKLLENKYTNGDNCECWLESMAEEIRARGTA